jgi:hypothetical protein
VAGSVSSDNGFTLRFFDLRCSEASFFLCSIRLFSSTSSSASGLIGMTLSCVNALPH